MIRWSRTGSIATIMIDRGGAGNAISHAGWLRLAEAARDIARSDVAAVVLMSADPRFFSGGADLEEMTALADDAAARVVFREALRAGVDGLATLPMPVIAAVDGGCYGASVALILACDICVAGDGAHFALTPAKLGIVYPATDVARLRERVGRSQAGRLLFTAAPVGADEALRIGLADVRAPDAGAAATTIAEQIAANAPGAVRLLKRILNDPTRDTADAEFDAAFGEDEFAKRLAAFRTRLRNGLARDTPAAT